MKRILAIVIGLGATSIFARTDFERGYAKGEKACSLSANIVIEHFSTAYPIDENDLIKKLGSQCRNGKLSKISCVDKGNYYVNTVVCAALCNQK